MRVVDLPHQHGLVVQKAAVLGCLRRIHQQMGMYLLDGNPVVAEGVTGQVHDAAGTAPEFALDLVFADLHGCEV